MTFSLTLHGLLWAALSAFPPGVSAGAARAGILRLSLAESPAPVNAPLPVPPEPPDPDRSVWFEDLPEGPPDPGPALDTDHIGVRNAQARERPGAPGEEMELAAEEMFDLQTFMEPVDDPAPAPRQEKPARSEPVEHQSPKGLTPFLKTLQEPDRIEWREVPKNPGGGFRMKVGIPTCRGGSAAADVRPLAGVTQKGGPAVDVKFHKYAKYYRHIRRRVIVSWEIERAARARRCYSAPEERLIVVEFQVAPDGRVGQLNLLRDGGLALVAGDILAAVRDAGPFRAFRAYKVKEKRLQIRFYFYIF